jgi:hypothetical protein
MSNATQFGTATFEAGDALIVPPDTVQSVKTEGS